MMSEVEFNLLSKAARRPEVGKAVETYLSLRELFENLSATGQEKFRRNFFRFYKLNAAGLSNEWKDRYFEWLVEFPKRESPRPYQTILCDLHKFPRIKATTLCSFRSSLNLLHFTTRQSLSMTSLFAIILDWEHLAWGLSISGLQGL